MSTIANPPDPLTSGPYATVAWTFAAGALALTAWYYGRLPDEIPVHWNTAGEINGYGPKAILWLLPVLNVLLCYGMGWISRAPRSSFNYPVDITPENEATQRALSLGLVAGIRAVASVLLFYLTYATVESALSGENRMQTWLILALLGLMFVLIGHYYRKAARYE